MFISFSDTSRGQCAFDGMGVVTDSVGLLFGYGPGLF
jgi:hypothetical protein